MSPLHASGPSVPSRGGGAVALTAGPPPSLSPPLGVCQSVNSGARKSVFCRAGSQARTLGSRTRPQLPSPAPPAHPFIRRHGRSIRRVPRDWVWLALARCPQRPSRTHHPCSPCPHSPTSPRPQAWRHPRWSLLCPSWGSLNVLSHGLGLEERGGDLEEGQEERIVKFLRFSRRRSSWD